MAEQERNPWIPATVQGGYQQALNMDFSFNAPAAEDSGFLEGLMYNPLAAQNSVLGPDAYAQIGSEDFKPLASLSQGGLPGPSSWIRGSDRMQYETSAGREGSGNMTFLHQQELHPASRVEPAPSGATGAGPSDSGTKSQDDEVSAARKEMKSNREKLLRDRMNDHFAELAGVLDPGRPPKNDKASILNDGVCVVRKLRDEIAKLQSEHSVLLDESKELTVEKNELKEERQQVKNEKEALERRLQGMLSWMNFNPSLMMAAMANSAQPPPPDTATATPPNQSGPNHPPTEVTPPVETDLQRVSEQAVNTFGAARSPAAGPVTGVGSRQQGVGLGANQTARQGVNQAANQGAKPGRYVQERTAPFVGQASAAQQGSQKQGSIRGGSNPQQPTRPLPVYQAVPQMHLRPSIVQPAAQPAGGLRNLQPAPERAVRNHPTVGKASQPVAHPAVGRHVAPRQQPRAVSTQAGGVVDRPQGPPLQNPRGAAVLPVTGQLQSGGATRVAAESGRKARGQVQGNHSHAAGAAQAGVAQPIGGGHVAASEHTSTAPRVEKRKGQASADAPAEHPVEKPQERPTPAEQPAPIPTPHPYPPAFPHMPYMGPFPGMMGMHAYPFPPPQLPPPTTAPAPETAQQPPTAPYPYHGYPYSQPGYPYPVYPHAHPMAYPGFGFAHPYAAPGISPFAMPPGGQPAQAEPTRTTTVERPNAQLALVQTPEGNGLESARVGSDGNSGSKAVPEETGRVADAENQPPEEPEGCTVSEQGDGFVHEPSARPETANSQAAKRPRVDLPTNDADCPPKSSRDSQEYAGLVSEGTDRVAEVERLHSGVLSPTRAIEGDGSAMPEPQSSPILMGSQPSNCSSSSSGSHYGELWTQSFQSALGLPEHDPTIRPPAA